MKELQPLLLLITLCITFSGRHGLSQDSAGFSDLTINLYLNEQYPTAAAAAVDDIRPYGPPEKVPAHLAIRLAYFFSWADAAGSKFFQDLFIHVWKTTYPDSLPSDSIPAAQRSDYLAVRAVDQMNATKMAEATRLFRESVSLHNLATRLDTAILADKYQLLGRLAKNQQDYTTAMESFTEAIRLNQSIDRQIAIQGIHLEKAAAQLKTDPDNPLILSNLHQAAQYFSERSDYPKLAWAYNELGTYWSAKEEPRQAISWFRSALELNKKYLQTDLSAAYNNLSAMYHAIGLTDSIIYYMVKAVESVPEDDYSTRAEYLSNLGALYGTQNETDLALQCFNQALQALLPDTPVDRLDYNPDPEIFSPTLPLVLSNKGNALLQLYYHTGNQDFLHDALTSLSVAITQFNSLRELSAPGSRLIFGSQNRDYYFLGLEAAAELFRIEPTPDHAGRLLNFCQQSKAAVFNDFQRVLAARDQMQLDERLIRQEDSLKLKISTLQQTRLTANRQAHLPADSLQQINLNIIHTRHQLDSLQKMISAAYPGYTGYIQSPEPVPMETLQKHLHAGEVIIDYTYNSRTLLIISISKDTVMVSKQKLPQDFDNQVHEYLALMNEETGSHFSRMIRLAHHFYTLLLEPAGEIIRGKSLVIIPDGRIGYLPFDTFCTDSLVPERKHFQEASLLIKDHAIRFVSSVRQLTDSPGPAADGSRKVMAYAPFTRQSFENEKTRLPRLEGSKKEIQAIAHHARVRSFTDQKASKNQFLSHVSQPDIIHLATHGLLSSGNPMNNRILFSQDHHEASLALFEVISLPVKSDLVVLSACETGSGDLQQGEGIMSLTRGFHNAGTPAIIMSLWPAYDNPSVQIMDDFYRQLREGQYLSEALRQSKLTYLEQATSVFSHPSYWANYQLSGQDFRIRLESPWFHRLKFLLPLLLLIPVFALKKRFFRRKHN